MFSSQMASCCNSAKVLTLLAVLIWPGTGRAVLLDETGDALANTTTPTGAYAGSGWDYQGYYGSYLGTMIAPQFFITAQHIGVSLDPTFTKPGEMTYTIDAAANGGLGYWDIAGTDLRIFKINETFSSYAQLYTGAGEAGQGLTVFGRGGPRGAEVEFEGELRGWEHTGSDGVMRWGTNAVENIVSFGAGDLLRADFDHNLDPLLGQHEATLSSGDSGGGVFILDGGVWKLAGVNYGVDGFFNLNNIPGNDPEIQAALFDRGGFYQGSDAGGWSINPLPANSPANFYASRISSSAAEIQSIIAVPEPGGVTLLMLGMLLVFRRRRGN